MSILLWSRQWNYIHSCPSNCRESNEIVFGSGKILNENEEFRYQNDTMNSAKFIGITIDSNEDVDGYWRFSRDSGKFCKCHAHSNWYVKFCSYWELYSNIYQFLTHYLFSVHQLWFQYDFYNEEMQHGDIWVSESEQHHLVFTIKGCNNARIGYNAFCILLKPSAE